MSDGEFQAFALLACPVVTGVLLWRCANTKPSLKAYAIAILLAIPLSLVGLAVGTHACHYGQPFSQWFVPGLCLLVLFGGIASRYVKIIAGGVIFALMLFLNMSYASLAHRPNFIGISSLSKAPKNFDPSIKGIDGLWHSWLTGIYRRNSSNGD